MPYYPDSCPRICFPASALISRSLFLVVSSFSSIGFSLSLGFLQVLFLRVVNRIYGRPSTNGTDAILSHIRRKKEQRRSTTHVRPPRAANRHFDTKTHKDTHTGTRRHTHGQPYGPLLVSLPCKMQIQASSTTTTTSEGCDDEIFNEIESSLKVSGKLIKAKSQGNLARTATGTGTGVSINYRRDMHKCK